MRYIKSTPFLEAVAQRHIQRITRDDITRPIPCTCATCGGPATIYPYPQPKGSCVCAVCTGPLGGFIKHMSTKMQSGEIPLARN